jgi:ribosomal protein L35AE/L33A
MTMFLDVYVGRRMQGGLVRVHGNRAACRDPVTPFIHISLLGGPAH